MSGYVHTSADVIGPYRYRLERRWGSGPLVTWIMLNPSTADGLLDDPTIRRCVAFSKKWGYGGMVVVNLFALRATVPDVLSTHEAPVGPLNSVYIANAIDEVSLVVAAWGTLGTLGGRDQEVARQAAELGKSLFCVRQTKGGHPGHPLYVPSKAEPVPWTPPTTTQRRCC